MTELLTGSLSLPLGGCLLSSVGLSSLMLSCRSFTVGKMALNGKEIMVPQNWLDVQLSR